MHVRNVIVIFFFSLDIEFDGIKMMAKLCDFVTLISITCAPFDVFLHEQGKRSQLLRQRESDKDINF